MISHFNHHINMNISSWRLGRGNTDRQLSNIFPRSQTTFWSRFVPFGQKVVQATEEKKLKSFLKTSNKKFFFFYFHTQKQQQTSKSLNWAKQKKVKEFRGSFFNSKRANIRNEISGISRELKLCKSFPSLEGIFQPRELSFANRNLFMPFGDSLSLSVCINVCVSDIFRCFFKRDSSSLDLPAFSNTWHSKFSPGLIGIVHRRVHRRRFLALLGGHRQERDFLQHSRGACPGFHPPVGVFVGLIWTAARNENCARKSFLRFIILIR